MTFRYSLRLCVDSSSKWLLGESEDGGGGKLAETAGCIPNETRAFFKAASVGSESAVRSRMGSEQKCPSGMVNKSCRQKALNYWDTIGETNIDGRKKKNKGKKTSRRRCFFRIRIEFATCLFC